MARHTFAVRKSVSKNWITPVLRRFRRNKGAVSPAISTVVLTGAIVTMLVATIPFAQNFLDARTAEYEFGAMKESMQTVALQINDVAWTIGRTQTIHYASRFGWASFQSLALNYTVSFYNGTDWVYLANYSTGILMFNMATSRFSLGNNYYERLYPLNSSFLLDGVSAPISHVYVIEKLPMSDGSLIRVVIAPSIRMIESMISFPDNQSTHYYKLYLPILVSGNSSGSSQSIRLVGSTISLKTLKTNSTIQKLKVQIFFPKSDSGFDQSFFNFDNVENEVIIDVPDGSIIEFYTMNVAVSLGVD